MNLSRREKFDIYTEDSDQADIITTLCSISSNINENQSLNFLIFLTLNEAADLRLSIKYILITVGIAGVFLSLILTFVFTQKIRSQLSSLSSATELTKQGNFKNKIEIKSNDEIGRLASAFNSMLDELDKHDRAITEYSDFLALINRNASLKEIADAALNKIIKTCGFAVGAIYAVKNNSITLIRSYGIKGKTAGFVHMELKEKLLRKILSFLIRQLRIEKFLNFVLKKIFQRFHLGLSLLKLSTCC